MRTFIILFFILIFFDSNSQEISRNKIIGCWTYESIRIIRTLGCGPNLSSKNIDSSSYQFVFYVSGELGILKKKIKESKQEEFFGFWHLMEDDQVELKTDEFDMVFKIMFKNENLYLTNKFAELKFKKNDENRY